MPQSGILVLSRRLLWAPTVIAACLVAPCAAHAQRPQRQSVSGPAAPQEGPRGEESVYRLLRAQLAALVEAQDLVRAETGQYAQRFGRGAQAVAFVPRAGVTVTLDHATGAGWAATASHAALAGKTCVIWVGMVRPDRRPTTRFDANSGNEAEIICDLVP